MGALCLLFPSTPPSCPCGSGAARSSVPVLAATPSPSSTSTAAAAATRLQLSGRSQGRAGVARVGGGGKGEGAKDAGAAAFFGEDGVVEDMDGYLNYLSLEYDSVWDTKPACWVLQSVIVTAGVSFIICAWWYIFLYSYPKAYTEMIADRRRKVASGAEDTYGTEKIQ
ncbi:unnamed protein product [Urochloa decumbens]|uniref:DUF6737 domain-containing protein n=1 Tax=Urochloa decumbens TaxID=240449 RepID=A0ABC8X135_9POAL